MTKTKIMAIDDEPGVTRLIRLNLETTGMYEVLAVNEAESALAGARRFKPDLILLDVMMPNLHGGELAEQFGSDPELQKIPIIFLTAIVRRKDAGSGARAAGGRRVLSKPIGLNALMSCIQDTLREQLELNAQEQHN